MDLILVNGKIHTMDSSLPIAEAVAIKDGRIKAVGSSEEVLKSAEDKTEIIDLRGKVALPGFNDSHMHLYSFGDSLTMVNLFSADSIESVVNMVKRFIEERQIKKGQWLRGRGWNQDYFSEEKRFPNRFDLDKISIDHPIILFRACGHVAIVNSAALKYAEITANSPQVEGGQFDVDEKGEPLGVFRENAIKLISEKIPKIELEDIKAIIKSAAVYANSKGITSIQTDDIGHIPGNDFNLLFKAYNELKEGGELTVRINEQCLLASMNSLEDFSKLSYKTGEGDEFFRVGPLKLLTDGSLGARTAALCKPYADEPSNRGICTYSQGELSEIVEAAHSMGMQLAIHCIGDRSMHMAFESLEKALKNKPVEDHRHGIVHCQITDEVLINKFSELNVLALIQPIFLHYDIHIVEDRIGRERSGSTYAFKTLLNRGIHIALGTDCPVEPLDPMPNIYCAVNRTDLKGYPEGGWLPEEKLTLEEALYGYTMGGAIASFEEDIKGSITEGKLGDIVVLSQDIYHEPENKIKDIEIEMTIVGGRIVYRNPERLQL